MALCEVSNVFVYQNIQTFIYLFIFQHAYFVGNLFNVYFIFNTGEGVDRYRMGAYRLNRPKHSFFHFVNFG